jgi:hypothetical protein
MEINNADQAEMAIQMKKEEHQKEPSIVEFNSPQMS